MRNPIKHGKGPFRIAVIHGGPGAAGEMAPVARELSSDCGVLEPLQTAATVAGQVEELRGLLAAHAELPVTLMGFSWGAWLGLLLAAQHPDAVRKLILVSSGPLEEKYAASILPTRMGRLSDTESVEAETLLRDAENPAKGAAAFTRLGQLFAKADAYDPLPETSETMAPSVEIFRSVWTEAAELRGTGKLLDEARQVRCPVAAIHGDYDPHPAEGVREPLARVLADFRFHLLKDCGHRPWMERQGRDNFFALLGVEIQ